MFIGDREDISPEFRACIHECENWDSIMNNLMVCHFYMPQVWAGPLVGSICRVVTRQMERTNEFLQVKPNLPWDQRQALSMTVSGKIKASLHWPESLRWEWWWKDAFFHCVLNNFVSKIAQLLFWNCLMSTHTAHLLMSPGIWGSLQIWGSRVLAWVVISPCL